MSTRSSRAATWSRIGRWAGLIGAAVLLALAGLSVLGALMFGVSESDIARNRCKEYHDQAITWAKIRGELPTRLEDMEAPLLPGEPEFIVVIDDPWGHPYELERHADDVRIRSAGPDGRAHTSDDITDP